MGACPKWYEFRRQIRRKIYGYVMKRMRLWWLGRLEDQEMTEALYINEINFELSDVKPEVLALLKGK